MKAGEPSRAGKVRALYEEARARFSSRPGSVGETVPEPWDGLATDHGIDQEEADPRSLLSRLRSVDGQLEANLQLVHGLKETEEEATSAARGPARSPEEARRTVFAARSFIEANGKTVREAEERIEGLTEERRRLIERMARSGFFENRWVNDDGRAVYLESDGKTPPTYDLHEGPWGWVKDAPPGEAPRETLRRGPLLERRRRRDREMAVLFGVPFAAYWIARSFPPLPQHYVIFAAVAAVLVLLFYLPLAREKLFGSWGFGQQAERRLAEESAASIQIGLIDRGEKDPPSLDEITQDVLRPGRRKAERGKLSLITVVKDPMDGLKRIEHPDDDRDEGAR